MSNRKIGAIPNLATGVPKKRCMKLPLRNTILSIAVVVALFALRIVSVAGHADRTSVIQVQRPLMGTSWTIEVVDHGRPDAARRAIDQAYAELARIDALMSEWKPDSPLSAINTAAGKNPVEVPAELREIIQRSNRYSEMSEGAFDITWHGMANIWHFDDRFKVPTQAEVDQARRNVNFREILIDGNRVFLPRAGMSIGLGGIAKGYAVDRTSQVSRRAPDSRTRWSTAAAIFAFRERALEFPGRSGFRTRARNAGRSSDACPPRTARWPAPATMSASVS